MLNTPAPFPHVGSYALFIDTDLPIEQQAPELVRIQKRDAPGQGQLVLVSFPLRLDRASGNKTVPADELLDGTPLTGTEQRELADLQRELAQVVRPRRTKLKRRDALRSRAIWSVILAKRLREASLRKAA